MGHLPEWKLRLNGLRFGMATIIDQELDIVVRCYTYMCIAFLGNVYSG